MLVSWTSFVDPVQLYFLVLSSILHISPLLQQGLKQEKICTRFWWCFLTLKNAKSSHLASHSMTHTHSISSDVFHNHCKPFHFEAQNNFWASTSHVAQSINSPHPLAKPCFESKSSFRLHAVKVIQLNLTLNLAWNQILLYMHKQPDKMCSHPESWSNKPTMTRHCLLNNCYFKPCFCFNPLTPMCNQDRVSHYNINTISTR